MLYILPFLQNIVTDKPDMKYLNTKHQLATFNHKSAQF